ncbi:hypothetical protein O181_048866 [Austropuccinia psidii MF-1]|uniref:Integrase catalytic domain-containing protein n=1 Tax=Austropuccinia psidii MF-1 TaxID=1389203 RepID=A0A9Q3DYT4_9BASI|nr:hypothetical protein [Austropuccinia psidii MF-1]
MNTALLLWNKMIETCELPKILISDKDCKFTSELWKNLHDILQTNPAFSTSYQLQTDFLAERMIKTMENFIRRFCAYWMEYTDHKGLLHDWVTCLPAIQLA